MSQLVCVPVVQRPGYTIFLEQCEGLTFIHDRITAGWNRTLRDAYRMDLYALLGLHGGPLYVMSNAPHGDDYAKHAKFVTSMGARYLCHAESAADGVQRPVFILRKD